MAVEKSLSLATFHVSELVVVFFHRRNHLWTAEERSGLVFNESPKLRLILRGIVHGDLEGVMVAPIQFVFGTQISRDRVNLNQMYEYLPAKEKDKYY